MRKATGVTRVREWRGGVPAPICSVRVGFRGGKKFSDERRYEDRRNSRDHERANSSRDFTSFSLASSARSAARYLVRASP